jgi:tetrahydromethanopterin S-methyltransferase subunit B
MSPKEAIDKIKSLFADDNTPTPVPPVEKMEAKEYTLEGGAKVLITELEPGGMVTVVAEDGSISAAPVGDHKLVDGTVITVDELGVITGIVVPSVEPVVAPEVAELTQKVAQLQEVVKVLESAVKMQEQKFNADIAATKLNVKAMAEIFTAMVEIPSANETQKVKNNFDSHLKLTREQKITNFLAFAKTLKNK